MIRKDYTQVPNEFLADLPNMSYCSFTLYVFLRKFINTTKSVNSVFPSYEYLHEKTGMSRATIKKSQDELLDRGWIAKIQKRFNGSNIYFINDSRHISAPNLDECME